MLLLIPKSGKSVNVPNASLSFSENKRRFWIAAGMLLAAAAALFSLRFVSFDNDISVMLPREPGILRTFQFFRDAPFARYAAVSFEAEEANVSQAELIRAAGRFAGGIDTPLITGVLTGFAPQQAAKDMLEFIRLAPQLSGEKRTQEMQAKISAGVIRKKLEEIRRILLTPAGSWMMPKIRLDPLGLHDESLRILRDLSADPNYAVELQDGHFVSRDGRHVLIMLETAVPVTDGEGARQLLNYLNGRLKNLPKGIRADIIAGHRHSVSNEKTIKRDIWITTAVTSCVFVLLFIFLFRDPRALLLFITPSISVLLSIPLCGFIAGRLSYIIMGMGAVISGIAVDYCIHVYVAMQAGQSRNEALREIAKPVISGALTTAGVFAVFLLSGVPGNRQLALFTVISTVISLGLALFVFPYFLSKPLKAFEDRQKKFFKGLPLSWDRTIIVLWILFAGLCLWAASSVKFKTDVKQYDGSESRIFAAEEKFRQIWGGKERPGMVVIQAADFEKALILSQTVQESIKTVLKDKPYTALNSVWLPEEERVSNLRRWNLFWDQNKEAQKTFVDESRAAGFSESAFNEFYAGWRMNETVLQDFEKIPALQQLKKRFGFQGTQGYTLVGYFPDESGLAEKVSAAVEKYEGVFVVSSRQFEKRLSEATLSEAFKLSLLIVVILPVLAFLFLKNIRHVLISLVPVASSLFFILAMLSVLKLPLNVASIIALMVVGGFSIDYGTFMIHHITHQLKTNTYLAVTISALTIFFGAGSLMFARHPVLFSYGSTMVFGIGAGYAAALFAVPAFCRLGNRS